MDFGTLVIIVMILSVVSASCSAMIDKINFHYNKSIFSKFSNQLYWNPSKSWINKWKHEDVYCMPVEYRHWYYFGLYKTPYRERFIYSSTILVFLTDGFHTIKFIMNTAIQLIIAICLYNCGIEFYHPGVLMFLLLFVIIKIIYNFIFYILFDIILVKK